MAQAAPINVQARLDEIIAKQRRRNASLSNEMRLQQPIWEDIRNFLAPRTARFPGEVVNDPKRQDLNIINTAPRLAVRTLPSGLQSGVTSPMRPWFRLSLPDPELSDFKDVKEWLYEVERRMRDVMARSNMYDRLKSNYHMLGTYGSSCLFVDEDVDEVIRCHDFPIGSFKISTSAPGRVDSVYRDLRMRVRQLVEKFKDKAPERAKLEYAAGNYETLFDVVHVVEPNELYDPGSVKSGSKRYCSVWLDMSVDAARSVMSYSGYDDLPALCPRWDVLGEDTWGTGCGEFALGDAKQLQHMEKRKLQGIDKNTNPPMLADASMRNQRTTNLPGDTTYQNGLITGNAAYRPAYQVNPYITELREETQVVAGRIDDAFYKNLFMMVSEIADQPNITATQINTMREEKLLQLGPVLERLNNELLNPLINRVFNIMQRRGMLPPPPQHIQGMPLHVEYISVLAQAQKALGIGNIERFVGFVNQMAEAQIAAQQPPTALDKIDVNKTIDAYADGVGVPPTMVASDEEVQAIQDKRNQQQQGAQAMQMAQQGAATAKDLGQTPMNPNDPNAMTEMQKAAQTAGVG